MQEEVEQRTVTLIVNTAKLTERELQKAISKLLTPSFSICFVRKRMMYIAGDCRFMSAA